MKSKSSQGSFLHVVICVALVLVGATVSAAQTGSQRVDGRNVTSVEVENATYIMVPFACWVEKSSDGTMNGFVEEKRDAWSVHLWDAERDVRLQLDLKQMQVFYGEGKGAKRPLYNIMAGSADVTSDNVHVVRVKGAEFRMTGPETWAEVGSGGAKFTFAETKRDGSSVYLADASRGVTMQLDLRRKQVYYADSSSAQRPLYPITGVAAVGGK